MFLLDLKHLSNIYSPFHDCVLAPAPLQKMVDLQSPVVSLLGRAGPADGRRPEVLGCKETPPGLLNWAGESGEKNQ